MLKVNKIAEEKYICNNCGVEYDIRNALITKGNTYFCSMKCVLEYDKKFAQEALHV